MTSIDSHYKEANTTMVLTKQASVATNSQYLNGIQVGTGFNERDGLEIQLVSIDLKGQIKTKEETPFTTLSRLMLVYDCAPKAKAYYNTTFQYVPLFEDVCGAVPDEKVDYIPCTAGLREEFNSRFYILWDSLNEHEDWDAQGGNKAVKIDISVNLKGLKTIYQKGFSNDPPTYGTTYDACTFGAIYLMGTSDSVNDGERQHGSIFKGTYRIRYRD